MPKSVIKIEIKVCKFNDPLGIHIFTYCPVPNSYYEKGTFYICGCEIERRNEIKSLIQSLKRPLLSLRNLCILGVSTAEISWYRTHLIY